MRINEDYLENDNYSPEDVNDILERMLDDEFCDVIDSIVAGEYDGERPGFEYARDAIYPVDDMELRTVIKKLRKLYGFEEHMNLNWLDVSGVTHMNTLFYVAFLPDNSKAACNVDVSRWDVRNVVDTSYMFGWTTFNGDLSAWRLDSLEDCSYMFAYSLFNGDLSAWDISGVAGKRDMLNGCPIHKRMDCWPKGYYWD